MSAYKNYKQWWIENVFPAETGSLYYGSDAEQAFKQHIKDLGLYGLMEKLCEWSDDEN